MASAVTFLFCFSLVKMTLSISHHNSWSPPAPYLPPQQLDPTTPNIWTNQPTCKSANAQVYFLPTAPKPAKVTVLTEPAKVIAEAPKISKETSKDAPLLPVPPPPPPSAVLPGVLDKIPTIIPPVEATCPCLNRKSKILEQIFEKTSSVLPNAFHYDQDLLNGFLSSLGL